MPNQSPIFGTPIRGLGEIAHLAVQAANLSHAALSPDTGSSTHSISGSHSVSLSSDFPTAIACFRICGCWKRKKSKDATGATQGLHWICKATPVEYFVDFANRNSSHSSSGGSGSFAGSLAAQAVSFSSFLGGGSNSNGDSSQEPETYWQALKPDDNNTPTDIWCIIDGYPEHAEKCGNNGSTSGSVSGVGSLIAQASTGSQRKEKINKHWQRVLYPKYGVGQWVWCIYDYSASVWRVIDAYDDLVRFILKEPLKACKQARAEVFGIKCDSPPCGKRGSSTSSGSSSSHISSSYNSSASSSSPSVSDYSSSSHSSSNSYSSSRSSSLSSVSSSQSYSSHSSSFPVVSSSSIPINSLSVSSSVGPIHSSASVSSAQPSIPPSLSASVSGCAGGFVGHQTKPRKTSGSCGQGFSSSHSGPSSKTSSSQASYSSLFSSTSSSNDTGIECRGYINVVDQIGIVALSFPDTGIAPKGLCGWAKRCADSHKFEVLSFGDKKCLPGKTSSSSLSVASSHKHGSSISIQAESSNSSSNSHSSSSLLLSSYSASSSLSFSSGSYSSSSSFLYKSSSFISSYSISSLSSIPIHSYSTPSVSSGSGSETSSSSRSSSSVSSSSRSSSSVSYSPSSISSSSRSSSSVSYSPSSVPSSSRNSSSISYSPSSVPPSSILSSSSYPIPSSVPSSIPQPSYPSSSTGQLSSSGSIPSNFSFSSTQYPSSNPTSPRSGSGKSSAIVPAEWSPSGYTALFVEEQPEVRFDDVMIVTVPHIPLVFIQIDPRYIAVCEPNSIAVCGCVPLAPIAIGASVVADKIQIRFAEKVTSEKIQVTIRLTGIRRGFADMRFPDRTKEQFDANEKFIKSAYAPI